MQDRDGEKRDRPRPGQTARQSEIGDHEGEDFGVGGVRAEFHGGGAGPRRGHERVGRRGGGGGERAGVDRLPEPEKLRRAQTAASTRAGSDA